jgi:dienelactone hydrolase
MNSNMIGAYGPWAAGLVGEEPARFSFRRPEWKTVEQWQPLARNALHDRLLQPDAGGIPHATIQHQFQHDGLDIEHLSWQLPYGPPTEAILLKPAGATEGLPGVVGLHDHGGNKYFGTRKITRISEELHPLQQNHQNSYYGGVAWANELAKRGYVVLVHDAYAFASRRVRVHEVPNRIRDGLVEENPESVEEIREYNRWASDHEHLMAKSLYSAGTTWPGVFTAEDQRAVDYLCSRDEVDATRIGCAGLSGGGLRTTYLGGLDDRIRCACCVGMMTTWRDYLLNKCYTHTWMIYIPGLPLELDYPEVLGLRVPLPTLVQNNIDDQLFTLSEMKRADGMLAEVYRKARAEDRYRCSFYPGPHKFDLAMQAESFDWFDRWLK